MIFISRGTDEKLTTEAWQPLLEAAQLAAASDDQLRADMEAMRPNDRVHEKYRPDFNKVFLMHVHRSAAGEAIALVAKLAGREDMVKAAFATFGGRIKQYKSAEDFLRYNHPMEQLLHVNEGGATPTSRPATRHGLPYGSTTAPSVK